MKKNNTFRFFSLSLIWLWMFLFALLPFCLVLIASLLSHDEKNLVSLPFTLENYTQLLNTIYARIFEKSFVIAGIATFFCLFIGYPFAYIIARMQSSLKNIFLLLVIIPFWTSSLIRTYALIAIIKAKGLINSFLIALHIIHQPLSILFTPYAVIFGLVYNLLPFMVLPIMTSVEQLDQRILDAARDLGADRFTIFRKVVLPLTLPGIIAGSILVFLPAMTIFYIPDILGGAKSLLLGNLIQNQFLVVQNWPLGSAVSCVLTLILASLLLMYVKVSRNQRSQEWF